MDSSSAVEEANYQEKPKNSVDKSTVNRWLTGTEKSDGEEQYDAEAWETLNKSFIEAQSVLDQNRLLIQQVNENHQSKIPDNLVKNVALIQEINGNISKQAVQTESTITNVRQVLGMQHQANCFDALCSKLLAILNQVAGDLGL